MGKRRSVGILPIQRKIKAKGNYINDIKEGHWDYYYPSQNKGNYKKGKKDGLWIYYNPSGGISSKEIIKKASNTVNGSIL